MHHTTLTFAATFSPSVHDDNDNDTPPIIAYCRRVIDCDSESHKSAISIKYPNRWAKFWTILLFFYHHPWRINSRILCAVESWHRELCTRVTHVNEAAAKCANRRENRAQARRRKWVAKIVGEHMESTPYAERERGINLCVVGSSVRTFFDWRLEAYFVSIQCTTPL